MSRNVRIIAVDDARRHSLSRTTLPLVLTLDRVVPRTARWTPGESAMPIPPSRPFTILDAMAFTAATAVGLTLAR